MNTAMRIERLAEEAGASFVVRKNNRLVLEEMANELELDISSMTMNDDMVLDAIAEAVEEEEE